MDMMDQAIEDIEDIKEDLSDIEEQVFKKIAILDTCYDYATSVLSNIELQETARTKDTVWFGMDEGTKVIDGEGYARYGQTAHAEWVAQPTQVFNFITGTGPVFKDNAAVSFIYEDHNETVTDYKYEYCNILKDEADDSKQDVFRDDFPQPEITLSIEVRPSNLVGNSSCNMIEICPYLPGTFTIEAIRIWTINQYLSNDMNVPDYSPNDIYYENVGAQRIMLDDTYQIYKIEFDITIDQIGDGFPFGLKHLYFYNADMDLANDYAVVRIDKENYIKSVGNTVTVTTPEGTETVQLKEYCSPEDPDNYIRYFMIYENGLLQNEIRIQNNVTESIARNITTIYATVPLHQPIKAITFNDIKTK